MFRVSLTRSQLQLSATAFANVIDQDLKFLFIFSLYRKSLLFHERHPWVSCDLTDNLLWPLQKA